MSEFGIANVWLCHGCGRFVFTKPETDTNGMPRPCLACNGSMELLLEQAVITVRARP